MSNLHFTEILSNTIVASTDAGITVTDSFANINGTTFLAKLKRVSVVRDKLTTPHYLRAPLKLDANGNCYPRSKDKVEPLSSLVIIDADKRITPTGEIIEGAPEPLLVSTTLKALNISFILYGSYSHYTGLQGNRYRIILSANKPYTPNQLAPTVEEIISLINSRLDGDLLANALENSRFANAWFYPSRPEGSTIENLYLEFLEGKALEVLNPIELPSTSKIIKSNFSIKSDELSAIDAFNTQNSITDLLLLHGYKRVHTSHDMETWLSPTSQSGKAGIKVKDNRIFSHHSSDVFSDGYWHSAFDVMMTLGKLTFKDAVIKAAQTTLAPNGDSIDAWNKARLNKNTGTSNTEHGGTVLPKPILHAKILSQLLVEITPVNFREHANISEKENLKHNHFQIIAIETILNLAKQHNWGICRNHDFIYLYNGEFWNYIDKDELEVFFGDAAEKMGVDKFKAKHFSFREQLYKQFIALAHLPKPEQSNDTVFINLLNGTFQITPTGTSLEPFSHENFITYQLPFEYRPDAKAPLFQKYLDRVLPDKQLQDILSEYMGYVFVRPSTLKLEKTLLLYGKGANGKSVFYEIVRNLFGEQNTSEYSLQSLTNENGYFRAMIANKLINYASEINGKLESSTFKQLVSGEPVEARSPYGRPFTLKHYAKLIFNCNELPRDVEQTEAYFRRFLIIPFDVTIPENEQDKQLSKKIIDMELSGVFNWVLAGLKRLLDKKQFTDSEVVRNARKQYEKESDSVKLFMDEFSYKASATSYLPVKMLYQEYRFFCAEDGYKPVSSLNFKKRLENCNIYIQKKNTCMVAYIIKSPIEEQAYYKASRGT